MNWFYRQRSGGATFKSLRWLMASCAIAVIGFFETSAVTAPAIIPSPVKLESRECAFSFSPQTRIVVNAPSRATGDYLAERLRKPTGFKFSVEIQTNATTDNAIVITMQNVHADLGAEGYELIVSSNSVVIRASEQAGLFYGVQTLLQLLPPEIFSSNVVKGVNWQLPCVQIEDQPRFKWRGLMLDVSRHFFTKEEVKRVLDLMAMQKLNTFHWHLVDDQGWRIEIKKYPKLTDVGAWRTNASLIRAAHGTSPVTAHPAWAEPTAFGADGCYGGFYTQDEIRDVVAYAAARHITVVPEIEMPGHSVAALAAYPQFSCFGGPFSPDCGAGVLRGIYCAGNDDAFAFIEDVLSEVIPLFPAKYIHIGGDEVQKDTWKKCPKCQARIKSEGLKDEEELQSYFIRRMEKFVNAHGKTLIGWSEILQGGIAQSAVLMDWIGGGKEAASSGHDVVMTPQSHCYFDHYQSLDLKLEPRAIGGYTSLQKVVGFEPIPAGLDAANESHVLGAQANLWTEYIASAAHVDYMLFPRLCAMAEAVWSPKEVRDAAGLQQRIAVEYERLEKLGVNYRRNGSVPIGEWSPAKISTNVTAIEWDVTGKIGGKGEYHVTLEYTHGNHGLSIKSVSLLENEREVATDTHDGFTGIKQRRPVYILRLPTAKADAQYVLRARVAGDGGTDSFGRVSWVFVPEGKHPTE